MRFSPAFSIVCLIVAACATFCSFGCKPSDKPTDPSGASVAEVVNNADNAADVADETDVPAEEEDPTPSVGIPVDVEDPAPSVGIPGDVEDPAPSVGIPVDVEDPAPSVGIPGGEEDPAHSKKKIDGIEYGLTKDSVVVLGVDASVKVLDVPNEIDGLPVLAIGNDAFEGKSFSSVKLPETLLKIDDGAFNNCTLPERLEIPDSVTEIGYSAFGYAKGLKEIKLPSALDELKNYPFVDARDLVKIEISANNLKYKTIDGILFSKNGDKLVAYPDAKDDTTSYVVPDGVESIRGGAFIGNKTLKEIVLPTSLEELDLNALPDNPGFTAITLPENVSQIGASITGSGRRSFVVNADPDNNFFKEVDGVLYDKAGKRLVYYPITKKTTFCVPDGVESISRSTITTLKGIYIPASVKKIDDSFFAYYGKTTVYAPKGSFAEEYAEKHKCKFVAMDNGDEFPPANFGEDEGGAFETQLGKKMKLEGLCLDGSELDWESYRGKYVLVDFWTTWCGFCIEEIPFNKKLYEHYRDAGFDIIAFSCDDDLDDLKTFAEKNPEPWTIVSSQMSANAEKDYLNVPDYYEVSGYPTMVLVDPDGKIVDDNARDKHLQDLLEKAFPDVPKLADEE